MSTDEDYFKSIAKKKKEEEEQKEQERQANSEFTPILFSAFRKGGEAKLVRFRDGMIAENKSDLKTTKPDGSLLYDKYSARVVDMAYLYNDAGKKKQFFIPSKADEPDHLFWRLRDVVLKREWVADPESKEGKKKGIYVHAIKHPELVDRFLTNGKNHGISKNQFDPGWKTKQILFANIFDPSMVEVHKARNSWALLSRNENIVPSEVEGQPDKVYSDWGITAYGLVAQLRETVSHYGGLNSYDSLIVRPKNKEDGWKVRNATKYHEEVPEHLKSFINYSEELPEDVKNFELYDIESLTAPSDYRKWFKNFKTLLLEIDLKFNTKFHDEVERKAKLEEEIENQKKEDTPSMENSSVTDNNSVERTTEITQTESSTRQRSRNTTPDVSSDSPVTWEKLQSLGYKVSNEEFLKVQKYISHIDDLGVVKWKDGLGELIPDDKDCHFEGITGVEGVGFESPDHPDIQVCLYCGRPF